MPDLRQKYGFLSRYCPAKHFQTTSILCLHSILIPFAYTSFIARSSPSIIFAFPAFCRINRLDGVGGSIYIAVSFCSLLLRRQRDIILWESSSVRE